MLGDLINSINNSTGNSRETEPYLQNMKTKYFRKKFGRLQEFKHFCPGPMVIQPKKRNKYIKILY